MRDLTPEQHESLYEALAPLTEVEHKELWRLFRKHRPVGAYLPVGQLDGDCQCGRGSWPCETVQAALAPIITARIRQVRAEALREAADDLAKVAAQDHISFGGDAAVRVTLRVLEERWLRVAQEER